MRTIQEIGVQQVDYYATTLGRVGPWRARIGWQDIEVSKTLTLSHIVNGRVVSLFFETVAILAQEDLAAGQIYLPRAGAANVLIERAEGGGWVLCMGDFWQTPFAETYE